MSALVQCPLVARVDDDPTRSSWRCTAGFTLVEMLAVIALIAVLSGTVLGLAVGAHERAAVARAKAELAVLAQSVEAWRSQYGDYPAPAVPAEFYEALTGRRGPQNGVLDPPGRTFIETGRFALRAPDGTSAGNVLLDPWGQPYHYVRFSRQLGGNLTPGYVLFSGGPDGCVKPDDPPASGAMAGVPDLSAPENADNIYSSQ
jgi:prepilin-type N-terminal cleavage/methylation domain-containing protein